LSVRKSQQNDPALDPFRDGKPPLSGRQHILRIGLA
jgi:hypothetical protein